jgi:non-lysosomal glucosylceramidase
MDDSLDRRDFVKIIGLGTAGLKARPAPAGQPFRAAGTETDPDWPALREYDQDHLARIALPLGGIGTGTVALGGRGDLRDWELMNRPAKGFVPTSSTVAPFFALFAKTPDAALCRLIEGPIEAHEYEGSHGGPAPNEHLPRFRHASFAAAYPFGRVTLSDPDVPLDVQIKAFNPLVPVDADASGIPIVAFTFSLRNRTTSRVEASVCATLPNFIGIDGWETQRDWKGDTIPIGAKKNRNALRRSGGLVGIFFSSEGVDPKSAAWGTMALATSAAGGVTARTSWVRDRWGSAVLDFWDDFAADGHLEERPVDESVDVPVASLAVPVEIAAGDAGEVTFLLAWHFPNRFSWTRARPPGLSERSESKGPSDEDWIGNYYTTRYADAWDVVQRETPRLSDLHRRTARFVSTFLASALPNEIKEAALFNLSTLRSQTCFRTPDGRFFGWEGTGNRAGCCHGSCTHVWNYEQATAFLFGELAWSMREVEFGHATSDEGLMSFRVNLPIGRAQQYGKAAADGQLGCVMKMYRDWQLSGRDERLRALWPKVRKAIEFCWIPGGWDADRDGVMEGCQHNTMDVEYYGPNPQMGIWYLGALRAGEEMARAIGETDFAATCRSLFERGRDWIDAQLFNGEYYEHHVRAPKSAGDIAPSLIVGMGAKDVTNPEFQLAAGCLVDQLVGQFMAHVCGLGYLVRPEHARTTLRSILKYNRRDSLHAHFNNMRTFALDGEAALLMASFPKGRPKNPFPYFGEVMTGFEYTAAVGMLYEGMIGEGLRCIRDVRARYDGRKRSPFDEAECGHHYARAMASWAALLALSGFHYSAPSKRVTFAAKAGRHFWSSGYAWGDCEIAAVGKGFTVRLHVLEGKLDVGELNLGTAGGAVVAPARELRAGDTLTADVRRKS